MFDQCHMFQLKDLKMKQLKFLVLVNIWLIFTGMYNPKQNHFINLRKSSNQKPFGFGKSKRKSMELDEIISMNL